MWKSKKINNKGFSLIELLIVLCISSLLISGLFAFYLQIHDHQQQNQATQTLSEETTFINTLLARAFYGAGFLGQTHWRDLPVYDVQQQKMLDTPIILLDANNPELPDNIRKKIKPDTQAIELKQMDFNLTHPINPISQGNTSITTQYHSSLDWEPNNYLIIADSQHAEMNRIVSMRKVTNKAQESIQLAYPLQNHYNNDAYIGLYFNRVYFIGDTGQKFPDNCPIYGLYVVTEDGMTEEISDFVSHWQIILNNDKTLFQLHTQLTLPKWIHGKPLSRDIDFFMASRE